MGGPHLYHDGLCVCRGLSSALRVARCGRSRSAGCVLCVLWAMSAAVLGGGVPCGGKHIIIGVCRLLCDHSVGGVPPPVSCYVTGGAAV